MEVETPWIGFNKLPVSLSGCGVDYSCWRHCYKAPGCPPHLATLVLVSQLSPDQQQVAIVLGGKVSNRVACNAMLIRSKILTDSNERKENKTDESMERGKMNYVSRCAFVCVS